MTSNLDTLMTHFPQLNWVENKSLANQTYFKLGGPAELYLETDQKNDVAEVITFCFKNQVPVTFLSGASNVLVDDDGIAGLVIRFTNDSFSLGNKLQDQQLCQVGAGLKTALLVRKTVDAGLTGLEYFLGVPGLVGGAVYNNAHYQGHLLGEYINRVEIITESGELKWLSQAECEFSYDSSRFHHTKELIVTVEFLLAPGDAATSQQLIAESTRKRAGTQPLGEPSSGCIFKNVPNTPELKAKFPQFKDKTEVPASFLIDQAGLKGSKEGAIEVSHKHAAFFINTGGGTSADVMKLIDRVKATIRARYGVELEEEVFYLS